VSLDVLGQAGVELAARGVLGSDAPVGGDIIKALYGPDVAKAFITQRAKIAKENNEKTKWELGKKLQIKIMTDACKYLCKSKKNQSAD